MRDLLDDVPPRRRALPQAVPAALRRSGRRRLTRRRAGRPDAARLRDDQRQPDRRARRLLGPRRAEAPLQGVERCDTPRPSESARTARVGIRRGVAVRRARACDARHRRGGPAELRLRRQTANWSRLRLSTSGPESSSSAGCARRRVCWTSSNWRASCLRSRLRSSAPATWTARSVAKRRTIPNLHVAGFVRDPDLRRMLRSARVVVIPSRCQDAGPLVPLEAMSHGTPVVAYSMGRSRRVRDAMRVGGGSCRSTSKRSPERQPSCTTTPAPGRRSRRMGSTPSRDGIRRRRTPNGSRPSTEGWHRTRRART